MSVFNSRNYNQVSTTVRVDQVRTDDGVNLEDYISDIVQKNQTQDLLLQNVPTISGSNTFTGSNTFNQQITYGSSIGAGEITGAKQLVSKEFVDASIVGLKASTNNWTGSNSFVAGVLQLGKSDNTTAISVYGTATFDKMPITSTDLTSTITDDKNFTNKKYVDNKVDSSIPYQPLPDSISYGQQAISYQNGGNWVLQYPNLGSGSTTNSTGTYISFYVNFPLTANNQTLLQNNVTFDFSHWFYQPATYTTQTPISTSQNIATYSSEVSDSSIPKLVGVFGLSSCQTTFNVVIRNGGVLVHAPVQATKLWNNNTNTANSQAPVIFKNNYINTSTIMSYYPIQFFYINDQKFEVRVGFPRMDNNPSKSYSMAILGFSAKLIASNPCTSANLPNGIAIATPSTQSNSMSGGAWISTN
jgi:hypothetical protein